MDWTEVTAPDLADFEKLAGEALAALPEKFRVPAAEIVLRIEDFASEEILSSMDIDSPFELTGLYDGVPLTEKSYADQPLQPDTIWLFRRAILVEWVARGDVALADLIAHVVVHELAHHFGWSDDDIAKIDEWWR